MGDRMVCFFLLWRKICRLNASLFALISGSGIKPSGLALITFVSSYRDSFNCWKSLLLLPWLQNIVQTIWILQLTSLLQKIQALNSHLQSSLIFILLLNHCVFSPDPFLVLRAVIILYLLWFSSPDMGFILSFELLLSLTSTARSPFSLNHS